MEGFQDYSAWLFPGQGSQEVGMGAKLLKKYSGAAETLKIAEEFAHANLRKLMERGPDQELRKTEYAQPALTAVSCAYVDLMNEAGLRPDFVAGHSLGELSALYAAGVLTLEDTLRLAAERGRLMSQCAFGGMLAVKGCEIELLEKLISKVTTGIVCLANLNAPSQLVISGDDTGLGELTQLVKEVGGECIRLNVSGPWHSPLVAVAACEFERVIATAEFSQPTCAVVLSSIAQTVGDPQQIKKIMMRQMSSPVRWFETIHLLTRSGVRRFYEVGAGKVLKGLMRRIIEDESTYQFCVTEQGRFLEEQLSKLGHPAVARESQ